MSTSRRYTPEEKAELLNNPYTARVTDTMVKFTLAFKKFFVQERREEKLSYRKIFNKAGYRKELLTDRQIESFVRQIRKELASEEGLQEPKVPKRASRGKMRDATKMKDLEKRVLILEQEIDFLKKSQHLREHGPTPRDSTS